MTTQAMAIDGLWENALEQLHRAHGDSAERLLLTAFVEGGAHKCSELRHHCERVAHLALQIGEEIGLSQQALDRLALAAVLHDCGKIALDPCVLDKPSCLSCDERIYIQTHSLRGAELLEDVASLQDIVPGVLHHHERWDGYGYPMGLQGEDTPLEARIIAVADSFDAMTSPRTYSDPLDSYQAFGVLYAERGFQFDPVMVEALAARHDQGASIRELCAI